MKIHKFLAADSGNQRGEHRKLETSTFPERGVEEIPRSAINRPFMLFACATLVANGETRFPSFIMYTFSLSLYLCLSSPLVSGWKLRKSSVGYSLRKTGKRESVDERRGWLRAFSFWRSGYAHVWSFLVVGSFFFYSLSWRTFLVRVYHSANRRRKSGCYDCVSLSGWPNGNGKQRKDFGYLAANLLLTLGLSLWWVFLNEPHYGSCGNGETEAPFAT